jgi:type I restriction enzyme M protein
MLEEIRASSMNLNIPLYVRSNRKSNGGASQDEQTLAGAIQQWQASSLQLRKSMDNLFAMLEEAGLGN